MLDPEGNTAVYLLFQYVRVCSVMRSAANGSGEALEKMKSDYEEGFRITNASEKRLALTILRLPEQLELAVVDLKLNRLCD